VINMLSPSRSLWSSRNKKPLYLLKINDDIIQKSRFDSRGFVWVLPVIIPLVHDHHPPRSWPSSPSFMTIIPLVHDHHPPRSWPQQGLTFPYDLLILSFLAFRSRDTISVDVLIDECPNQSRVIQNA
jgi:hypothetical protein